MSNETRRQKETEELYYRKAACELDILARRFVRRADEHSIPEAKKTAYAISRAATHLREKVNDAEQAAENAHLSSQKDDPRLEVGDKVEVRDESNSFWLARVTEIGMGMHCYRIKGLGGARHTWRKREHLALVDERSEASRYGGENAEMQDFATKVRPVIQWLNDHMHPHAKVIVTPTSAELVEGTFSTGDVSDCVQD